MMLRLKRQYFGHLMQRVDSLEKTLMLGGIGGRRRMGRQRMRWLDSMLLTQGHEFEQTWGDSEQQGSLACFSPWYRRVGHDLVTEQQQRLYRVNMKRWVYI